MDKNIGTAGTTEVKLGGNGEIYLILGDDFTLQGKRLTPNDSQNDTASLTIYAQSSGESQGSINLSSTNVTEQAKLDINGAITINGGNINISNTNVSENGQAAIMTTGGDVTINGGQVTVNGTSTHSGIICYSGKSITLGYKNAADFIKADHYLSNDGSNN